MAGVVATVSFFCFVKFSDILPIYQENSGIVGLFYNIDLFSYRHLFASALRVT